MKRSLLIYFALLFSGVASAQSIVCEKQGLTAVTLDEGFAAVKFVSHQADWVITPVQVQKNDVAIPRTMSADGKTYTYEFHTNIVGAPERTYMLGRRGSAITDQCVVKSLRRGFCVTYSLEEQKDSLQRMELQPGKTSRYMVKGAENKACVELTTVVDELKVSTPWTINETKSDNGARVISVIVDVEALTAMKQELDSLSQKLDDLEKAGRYSEMESLMALVDKKSAEYDSKSEISIGGDGIKTIIVPLADLTKKELRRYVVISITESFDMLLAHARKLRDERVSHTESSYYHAALTAYDKALKSNDIPKDKSSAIQEESNDMRFLRQNSFFAERAQVIVDKMEEKYGWESDSVYKYLSFRCEALKRIVEKHPEITGFRKMYEESEEIVSNHPKYKVTETVTTTVHRQVISGRVVKGSSFLLSVGGLRVFSAKKYEKNKDEDLVEIGKTKSDGSFRIPLKESTRYILFEGERKSHVINENTGNMGTLTLEH
jgi:hypothetical protein